MGQINVAQGTFEIIHEFMIINLNNKCTHRFTLFKVQRIIRVLMLLLLWQRCTSAIENKSTTWGFFINTLCLRPATMDFRTTSRWVWLVHNKIKHLALENKQSARNCCKREQKRFIDLVAQHFHWVSEHEPPMFALQARTELSEGPRGAHTRPPWANAIHWDVPLLAGQERGMRMSVLCCSTRLHRLKNAQSPPTNSTT